jgi:hypothetical protein
MQGAAMIHPLYAYLREPRDGHVSDDTAPEDITGLVNDQDLVRDVCAIFHEKMNVDTTCYAMGKVYDINGESFGCVSIISEDVAGIIGEPLQETQESINYALVSAYLEFRGLCDGKAEAVDAWDGYLDLVLARSTEGTEGTEATTELMPVPGKRRLCPMCPMCPLCSLFFALRAI